MRRAQLSLALLSLATACSWFDSATPSTEADAKASAIEAPRVPSKAPEAPADDSSSAPAPAPTKPETKANPAQKAAPPSSPPHFTAALTGKRSAPRLHPLADGNLLLSVGPQLYLVEDGKPLKEDPSLLAGLPSPLCPIDGKLENWLWDLDVTGRWPNAIFASIWVAAAPNAPQVPRPTYRRRSGTFMPMKLGGTSHTFHYAEARPYVDGSLLSLRRYMPRPPAGMRMTDCTEDDPRLVAKCDARFAEVELEAATSKPLVVTRGLPKGPDITGLLGTEPPPLTTFDSLPSGHVFAATDENPQDRVLVVTPVRAELMQLLGSGARLRIHVVRAVAEDLAFVAGNDGEPFDRSTPRLFRYDGRSWAEQTAPPCPEDTELRYFEQLSSGAQAALCLEPPEEDYGNPYQAQPVFWQAPGQDWVALPRTATALARRGDALWVTDNDGAYTTAPVTTALTPSSREALGRTVLADGPACLGLEKLG